METLIIQMYFVIGLLVILTITDVRQSKWSGI